MIQFSDDIGLDASVVADIPSASGKDSGMVAIIRQLHGGKELVPALMYDEVLSASFIEHHNQIRSLCARLLALEPAYFIESMDPSLLSSLTYDFGRNILEFEGYNAVADRGTVIRSDLRSLFSDVQWSHLQIEPWEIDDDDAVLEMMDGRFLNGYLDRIQGSYRHAAWMIANGKSRDVPSWEPDPWKVISDLDEFSSEWTPDQHRRHEESRVEALSNGVKKHRPIGSSVVVMGSSHTKSGVPSPVIPSIPYFEDVLPEKLPDHRLVVLETHAKPWTLVNWAIEE